MWNGAIRQIRYRLDGQPPQDVEQFLRFLDHFDLFGAELLQLEGGRMMAQYFYYGFPANGRSLMKKLFIPITCILTFLLARIILISDLSVYELFIPQMNGTTLLAAIIGGVVIAIIIKLGGPNSTMGMPV